MLASRQPIWVGWGPELVYLYNDAYKSIIGGKHPRMLGQPLRVVWNEIWSDIEPLLARALRGDEGTYVEEQLLIMERSGYPEETYYTFSYTPVPDDSAGVGGIICANTEDTKRVFGERQMTLLRALAAATTDLRTWQEVCERSAAILQTNPRDLPFAVIYTVSEDGTSALLGGTVGIERGHAAAPERLSLDETACWPIGESLRRHLPVLVEDLGGKFGALPTGAWKSPPTKALVLPIVSGEGGRVGALVVGTNPFRLLDGEFRGFLSLAAGQIGAAMAIADAYQAQAQRAEKLAEIDRAKTVFFSNVSHELRTPLTLMLGPLQDALEHGAMPPEATADLQVAHRNAQRLLKLVNSLLDFSRIEAGRIQATYEPTDLSRFTVELASSFRSAIEKAGVRFVVECEQIAEPVYVDHDMWEKVVLNLLSNAFKYTFRGEIRASMARVGSAVEFSVSDTGTGIPEKAMSRLFERFFRVEGSEGRTHEGTGIGLAMVAELVKLHGGSVRANSTLGRGSTFTVSIPLGTVHLPADRISTHQKRERPPGTSRGFLDDVEMWAPSEHLLAPDEPAVTSAVRAGSATVVLADDNADMRSYVTRVLSPRHRVIAVANGEEALAAISRERPDLVLSDVMMPRLDGFGLLRALRADPATASLPLVLVSARAGEEATIEGLQRGADDYLVKPFSARELVARVDAQIQMARVRDEAQRALRDSERRFRELVDALPAAVYTTDAEGRITHFNPACVALCGREPVRERDLWCVSWKLFHADGRPMRHDECAMAVSIKEGRSVQGSEAIAERPDGSRVWFAAYPTPQFDESGTVVGGINMLVDITERKRAEERLAVELASMQRLHELSVSLMQQDDVTDVMREVMTAAAELLGATHATAQLMSEDGRTLRLVDSVGFSPEFADGCREVTVDGITPCAASLRTRERVIVANLATAPAFAQFGQEMMPLGICAGMSTPLLAGDGGLLGVFSTFWDRPHEPDEHELRLIDLYVQLAARHVDRRVVQRMLRKNEERFRALTSATSEVMYRVSPDWSEVWQVRGRDFIADTSEPRRNWLETYLHPDDQATVLAAVEDAKRRKGVFELEHRVIRVDGTLGWIYSRAVPIFDEQGEITEWFGAASDVTQRKEAEHALREHAQTLARLYESLRASEASFRTFTDAAPAMLWATDPEGRCTFLSRGWSEFTGQAVDAALGAGWRDMVHPEDREAARDAFAVANTAREPTFVLEYRLRRADGQYRWAMDLGRARFGTGGEFLGYVGNVLDVHEQKLTANELARHRERLQQMVNERTRELEASHRQLRLAERMSALGTLSAGLGHDMGNLLVPVRVRLEALAEANLPDHLQKDVEAIRRSAEYLRKLSSGLRMLALDPSSAKNDAIELKTWLEEAEPMFRSVLPRNVQLQSRVNSEECWAHISKAALTQAIFNLVQNAGDALKPQSSGTVQLWIEARENTVRVGVTDDGPGMLPEIKARCMEPFFTTKPRDISTGLGLSLVYGLVHEAGGTIEVRSEPGEGTTFILDFPHAAPAQPGANRGSPPAGRASVSVRDARLRAIIASLLHECGYALAAAGDGEPDLRIVDQARDVHGTALNGPLLFLGRLEQPVEGVVVLGERPGLQALREAIRNAAKPPKKLEGA